MSILAGIIAAIFSYIFNKLALKKVGNIGINIIVPFIEEGSKTAMAFILDTNIIATHFVFGFIEGVYDIINSSEYIGKWAALASLISHSVFGVAVYLTAKAGYPIYLGALIAGLLHSGWNYYITTR